MSYHFSIYIDEEHHYHFTAALIYSSTTHERYRVALKGGHKTITLQNDRPYVLNKHINKPLKWQLIEGDIQDARLIILLSVKLESRIKKDVPVAHTEEATLF